MVVAVGPAGPDGWDGWPLQPGSAEVSGWGGDFLGFSVIRPVSAPPRRSSPSSLPGEGAGAGPGWEGPGAKPGRGRGSGRPGVKRRVDGTGPAPLDGQPGSWGSSNVHTGKVPRGCHQPGREGPPAPPRAHLGGCSGVLTLGSSRHPTSHPTGLSWGPWCHPSTGQGKHRWAVLPSNLFSQLHLS